MPNKGYKQTEEHRINISKAKKGFTPWMKGKYHTKEARRKISESHKGKSTWLKGLTKKTDERIRKISESLKGHIISKKTRKKIGESLKGKNSPKYGKPLSEEIRRKIGNANKGKKNGMYGKLHTKEARKKIGDGNRGKYVSQETRKGMRKRRLHQVFPVRDTSIEVKMQNILIEKDIIFEKHKPIFGQPDIFIKPNICIFCDGDYWHNLDRGKKRDKIVNKVLKEKGYTILRFWEHQINNNINDCIREIILLSTSKSN